MKKQPAKTNKQNKTKIQLKIKSKTVTNNFILTPRHTSPKDHTEKLTDHAHTERHRHQQITYQKNKNGEQRRVTTDSNRFTLRKKFEEDETGTHTPMVKRISVTQECFNKKKSCNSLLSTDKLKTRKKTHDKLNKNTSGELNTSMFQRVLGIIIKDYKQGRLKEKELEQTLVQLFDRKNRKKSVGRKKKKQPCSQTFSNEFLRSAHQLTSQIIPKKRKPSSDEDIEQRVLQRQGFVNKIIVKGITTSMFLKQDPSVSQLKDQQIRNVSRDPSYNINTSNSVKEINEQMRLIQAQFDQMGQSTMVTFEDKMAIKIQRAWRQYRTKKLLKNIAFCHSSQNAFNIIDAEFTDEQCQQGLHSPYLNKQQARFDSPKDKKNSAVISIQEEKSNQQYKELTQLLIQSLKEKKLTKQECLKNILNYLKFPLSQLPVTQQLQEDIQEQQQQIIAFENQFEEEESISLSGSRMKVLPQIINIEQLSQELLEPALSGQMNSFTNKYSSKDVAQNGEFYKGNSVVEEASQLDKSLTFVHSQTLAAQAFKSINIQNIQEGLRSREQALIIKKAKQMEDLTDRFFNNKLDKDQYLAEKIKIDKWFNYQSKELKRVKNSLMKSCNEARKMLDSEVATLNTEKSQKMLKCLSDKFLQKGSWAINRSNEEDKRFKKIKKLRQEKQIEDQQYSSQVPLDYQDIDKSEQLKQYKGQFVIKNKKQKPQQQQEGQSPKFEISPKMVRIVDQPDEINEYKYQQIEKTIEQDDDGFENLMDIGNIMHKASDQFEPNMEDSVEEHEMSLINNLINEHNNKFKYLCNDDKQDIFQFLFLDLVLEMFTESTEGQNKILRSAQAYISKAKRLRKIPKGIKTSISDSKQYLNVLTKYVLSLSNGLKNMSFPMGPSAIEMLRYMRDEIVQAEDEDAVSSTLVLPIDTFQKVSRLPELDLKLERYYEDQEKEQNRLSFLKTALNINNKSLFDCLNQMLDHERPYGVWGKPFPWKKSLAIDRKWKQGEEKKKLYKCMEKTVESCSYLCGILVDKQDSLFGSHRVSQEYVKQIREDRLSKMLANELIENEDRWIFYDDEETEILMEASSFITKKLIKEAVLQMVSITMKR